MSRTTGPAERRKKTADGAAEMVARLGRECAKHLMRRVLSSRAPPSDSLSRSVSLALLSTTKYGPAYQLTINKNNNSNNDNNNNPNRPTAEKTDNRGPEVDRRRSGRARAAEA